MLKHIPTGQPVSTGSKNHHHHDHGSQMVSGNWHHQHHATNTKLPREPSGIYDSLVHPLQKTIQSTASVHRHALNHSQLSVNNLSRLNHSQALNFSTLSTSKHSIDSTSPVGVNDISHLYNGNHHSMHYHPHLNRHNSGQTSLTIQLNDDQRMLHHQTNGDLDISRVSRLPSQETPSPAPVNVTRLAASAPVASSAIQSLSSPQTQLATITQANIAAGSGNAAASQLARQLDAPWMSFSLKRNNHKNSKSGVKEMLAFLALLCLVSLLLATLSHILLLKISPLNGTPSSFISPEEYTIIYEVTLVLCAVALSLNLFCLLVCAIQFLFAIKLVKSSYNQTYRTNMYLQKSSASRMCAVGGFFISVPVFLTGMILYTFLQFHSTPAIITSVFIGLGIVFCGCAMVHNVFLWQKEKTNEMTEIARAECEAVTQLELQRQQQQLFQTHNQCEGNSGRAIAGISHVDSTAPKHNNSKSSHVQRRNQSQHYHDLLRHVPLSPALLTLSASPGGHNHSNINVHRIPGSPSTTPADDHSPTTLIHKCLNRSQHHMQRDASRSVSPGLPVATLDLSSAATTNSPHELSTLV